MNLVKKTIGHLFLKRVQTDANKNAIGWIENNTVKFYNYKDYKNTVEALSLALIKKGIIPQDKICILSNTNKEWHFFDLSILCSGAVVVPIYHTYLPHEVEYIVNHAEAKMIIVENEDQFNKLIKVINNLSSLTSIVTLEKLSEENKAKIPNSIQYSTYQELLNLGAEEILSNPDIFEMRIDNLQETDIASIIYTSGTTGEPKGAVITQLGFTQMLLNVKQFANNSINEKDRTLTFLPLSHVFGRCDSLLNLIFGFETVYAESIDKIIENIQVVRPTIMLAVPRIFEKIYEKINLEISQGSLVKKSLFQWALNASNKYHQAISEDKTPSSMDILQQNAAFKIVFDKIYQKFGGRIRYFISGGAPLAPEIITFLRNANLTVLEGYGLTETIAPCALNPFSKQIPGSVGRPMGDVEISFADDHEILIRSKAMFTQYYKNEAATNDAIDGSGWFHTGDIGEFNQQGYLKITDRKKDIIITSGGKNIAPQKIENLLKLTPNIAQCVIIGDKRKYLSAIISIEKESFTNISKEFEDLTIEELSISPQVIEIIGKQVESVNDKLAKFETIKKFIIANREFNTDNYLTPSLKIKKKLVLEAFSSEIDSMYKD